MKSPGTRKTRLLDVRPLLARGEEPFDVIMQTIAGLGAEENLVLVTPFIPAPLIEKLRSEGFSARPERAADGAWRTLFSRP